MPRVKNQEGSKWSHYLRLKQSMTIFFVGCLAMALAGWPWPNRIYGEVFPFSNFPLFGAVISRKNDVGVLLIEADGKPVANPEAFEDTISNDAYYMLARIGRSMAAFEESRPLFESMHLAHFYRKNLKYQVILRSFDTLDYYKTGRYEFKIAKEYETTKDAQDH